MPQFYVVNTGKSIGGPARVLIAPASNPHITRIEDLVNTTTYAIANFSTYGYVDIGSTKTGLTMGTQSDVNQWENQQFGRYRLVPNHSEGTVATDALEYTQANKTLLMNAFAATDVIPAGPNQEHQTNFPALTAIKAYHVAALNLDQNGLIHCVYFPNCQWSGSNIQEMLERATQLSIPISFTAYPDATLLDPTTGNACFRVDFDQY